MKKSTQSSTKFNEILLQQVKADHDANLNKLKELSEKITNLNQEKKAAKEKGDKAKEKELDKQIDAILIDFQKPKYPSKTTLTWKFTQTTENNQVKHSSSETILNGKKINP